MTSTTENILLNILVFTAKDKGPFRGLSQSVQRLAIELLFHLASIDTKLLQVLVSCCQDDAGVNISVIEYIVQVLYYRCDMEKKKKQLAIFQRFLPSVLVNNRELKHATFLSRGRTPEVYCFPILPVLTLPHLYF